MNYEIVDVDALGRIGKIIVNNKEMVTPNLFPVIHPFKNLISTRDLKKIGAQCVFTNSYIIYQNNIFKEEVLNKGLHQFLNFEGIIATDSGAFQQYIYNNNQMDINAEEIEKFQEGLGADFSVILDVPVQPNDDYETAKKKVLTTIQRAKDNIKRRTNKECHWFGPIHGSRYEDLLKLSAIEINELDFDIFAIGGLVKAFLDYRFDLTLQILLNVKRTITPKKPLHMFGLGLPQFFSLAVACGCDLMDSAAYILFARENRYFTLSTGTSNLEELEEFPCHCPICSEYTPKELKNFDEELKIELLAKHNLYVSFSELRTIRQAIREGNLWELVGTRIRNHPNLVKAARNIDKNKLFFEIYEKIYKKRGRLYTSSIDLNRPLFHRYEEKMKNNFRVPKEAKYLIILPELDVKGENSPTIKNWLDILNNNTIISREYLHVVFISFFFGLIPLELIDTFPMGQHESIPSMGLNDMIYQNTIQKSEIFLNSYYRSYKKCGVLIPENYVNQFNEIIEFPLESPIHGLHSILKSKFNENYSIFDNLDDLLQFFKDDKN